MPPAVKIGITLLLVFLRQRLGSIGGTRLLREGVKIAMGKGVMPAAVWGLDCGDLRVPGWGRS